VVVVLIPDTVVVIIMRPNVKCGAGVFRSDSTTPGRAAR